MKGHLSAKTATRIRTRSLHMNSRKIEAFVSTLLLAVLAISSYLVAQEQLATEQPAHRQHRFRFVEIGTLGGPNLHFNFSGAANRLLNNRGTFIAQSDIDTIDPLCFGNPDCFVERAFRFQGGVHTELEPLPRGTNTQAFWINDRGVIAGFSQNGEIDPFLPTLEDFHAAIWRDNDVTDLGTLGGT
jgi:hypothetical protein